MNVWAMSNLFRRQKVVFSELSTRNAGRQAIQLLLLDPGHHRCEFVEFELGEAGYAVVVNDTGTAIAEIFKGENGRTAQAPGLQWTQPAEHDQLLTGDHRRYGHVQHRLVAIDLTKTAAGHRVETEILAAAKPAVGLAPPALGVNELLPGLIRWHGQFHLYPDVEAGVTDRNHLGSGHERHQQQQARLAVAAVLRGVISQRLLPRADGKGMVPSLVDLPDGCKFCDRCGHVMDVCRQREPELSEISGGHGVRCWLHVEP